MGFIWCPGHDAVAGALLQGLLEDARVEVPPILGQGALFAVFVTFSGNLIYIYIYIHIFKFLYIYNYIYIKQKGTTGLPSISVHTAWQGPGGVEGLGDALGAEHHGSIPSSWLG